MLAGHPFAGKSTLVTGLLGAIEHGEPFLGRATQTATALLLSEEDDHALHSRAVSLGLLELESEYVGRNGGVFALDWSELIRRATKHALASDRSLLVVDTFPGLAGLRGDEENDAGAIGERLRPLQAAAGEGLAVLFLHHFNKQGQPRGSQAFRGVVDIEMRLRKGRQQSFHINTVSRFATTLAPTLRGRLLMSATEWSFTTSGSHHSAAESADESTDSRLWKALLEAGPQGLTYGAIDEIEGLSRHIAKKRLPRWYPEKAGRYGRGTKRNPYRWYPRR
jgi:hypothetical protein